MIDQAGMLKIVAEGHSRYPAQFAFRALEMGFVKNNTGRRWRPQGAGLIGASLLRKLEDAKLIRYCGKWKNFELTLLGLSAIRQGQASENATCEVNQN